MYVVPLEPISDTSPEPPAIVSLAPLTVLTGVAPRSASQDNHSVGTGTPDPDGEAFEMSDPDRPISYCDI